MRDYKTMYRGKHKFRIFIPFLIIGVLALVGWVVMSLWNAILPDLLHVGMLNYWQALGLFVLCKILFGGFHSKGRPNRPPFANRAGLRQKWMNMSDEERARFKEQWRKRCE